MSLHLSGKENSGFAPYREHRASPRFDCNILVQFEAGQQSGLGVITDVSKHGIGLTCRCGAEPRGTVRVKPYRGQTTVGDSACYGRIVWARKVTDCGQMHVGVELQLDREWLQKVLHSDACAPAWDSPEQRLDLVMGY